MTPVRALLAALLLPLVAVPAARAATPVSCAWVDDAVNDATGLAAGTQAPVSDSNMDLQKLILASDASRVTMWLKVYALSAADQYAPTGRRFTFGFTVHTGGKDVQKEVHVLLPAAGGVVADDGVQAKLDDVGFELHITVPLARLGVAGLKAARRRPAAPADRFTLLTATVERWHGDLGSGGGAVGSPVDTMSGAFAYDHRAPSCVKVGR